MGMPRQGWEGWDQYAPFYDWENARTLGRRDVAFWQRVAAGANGPVLELGCGTGRLTRHLLDWGASVTAVDNCAEMLSAVPEAASRVLSDIESLDLEQRFDVALLASCLVNHPLPEVRSAFVQSAGRHLRPQGRLLVERHDHTWLRSVQPGRVAMVDDISISLEAVQRSADAIEMTVRYEAAGSAWRHSFVVAPLTEAEVETLLAAAGFDGFRWATQRRWLRASLVAQHRVRPEQSHA